MRLAPLLALSFFVLLGATEAPDRSAVDRSSDWAPADTVRLAVASGDPLVTELPGDDAWTFRTLRAPALSWLVGRSFYWRTLPAERGREFVLIERRYRSEPQDTLVLVVDVGAP